MMRTSVKKWAAPVFLAGLALLLAASGGKTEVEKPGPDATETTDCPALPVTPISFSSQLPGDPPADASLSDLATFAWQEFGALSWPAASQNGQVERGTPDSSAALGSGSPVVWETYRAKVELLPGTGDPHGVSQGPPTYGYSDPPEFVYETSSQLQAGGSDYLTSECGKIPPCSNLTLDVCASGAESPVVWHNLDETTQIGLNTMYAGAGTDTPPPSIPNQAQRIFFEAKANQNEYVYLASNQLYVFDPDPKNHERPTAQTYVDNGSTFFASVNAEAGSMVTVSAPTQPVITLPDDTIETKAAWRRLSSNDDASHFYTTTVRWYDQKPTSTGAQQLCYNDETFGLLSLHIIRKTPNYPAFIFATFEQEDNIKAADGDVIECPDGRVKPEYQNAFANPFSPALTVTSATQTAQEQIAVGSGACNPSQQLYFVNNSSNTRVPQGPVCVNQRVHDIPQAVYTVNYSAQQALAQKNVVWQYYKLINVQGQPIDKSDVTSDNMATFYLANSVVETNTSLQGFSGQQDPCSGYGGLVTDFLYQQFEGSGGTPCGPAAPSGQQFNTFDNVFSVGPVQSNGMVTVSKIDTGGCQGCHGNAQYFGGDFSFLVSAAPFPLSNPETPAEEIDTVAARYRLLVALPPTPPVH